MRDNKKFPLLKILIKSIFRTFMSSDKHIAASHFTKAARPFHFFYVVASYLKSVPLWLSQCLRA